MTTKHKEIPYTVCEMNSYVVVDARTEIQIDETEYTDTYTAARAALNYSRLTGRVVMVLEYDYTKHKVFATACS